MARQHRTKIIATLGPACDGREELKACLIAGVNLVRLNFSHGEVEQHQKRLEMARSIAAELNLEIGVIADLQGPKIRIASFTNDAAELVTGNEFVLDADLDESAGTSHSIGIKYKSLPNEVNADDILLLDDGLIRLRVINVANRKIHTIIEEGGILKNKKGINKFGGGLSAPALTTKDKEDIQHAVAMDVDYIAVSFPRNAQDILDARRLIRTAGGGDCGIIAKIERQEAVAAIDEIIHAADCVMVARGDLAIEIGDASVPRVQKDIIRKARDFDKTVITATQMMESMINNPVPTRAEVSDVANAVLDGTDAVMLSAETAAGRYPAQTVSSMVRICLEAEANPITMTSKHRMSEQFEYVDEAIAMAAMYTANHLNIKAIIALTESGSTPLWMSRIRSGIPIYGLARHISSLRRMTLYRGVFPIHFDPTSIEAASVNDAAINCLLERGLVSKNDRIIITKGNFMGTIGGTNSMKIITI